jgi:hypothetical protein
VVDKVKRRCYQSHSEQDRDLLPLSAVLESERTRAAEFFPVGLAGVPVLDSNEDIEVEH